MKVLKIEPVIQLEVTDDDVHALHCGLYLYQQKVQKMNPDKITTKIKLDTVARMIELVDSLL